MSKFKDSHKKLHMKKIERRKKGIGWKSKSDDVTFEMIFQKTKIYMFYSRFEPRKDDNNNQLPIPILVYRNAS